MFDNEEALMSTMTWTEADTERSAPWHSESATPAPTRIVVADDRMTAETAYRLACEGTALLWRGDYHNARQLLQAMGRRVDRKAPGPGDSPSETFRLQRRARNHRARVLGKLVVQLEQDHTLALRRAPDVRAACADVYGPSEGPMLIALTELLGVLGAAQWREKGVRIPALDATIYPHYGVFSPIRGEYIELVAQAPLAGAVRTAFDLGTGTGVLAALLAHRGVGQVVATDDSPRALACARENIDRLDLARAVSIVGPTLFPDGRADLIVCNPPWLPARPTSAIEHGVYDQDSAMLRGFLTGLAAHLEPGGEGWLILSDLAEHLGLRTRDDLLALIEGAGLHVIDKTDTTPQHPRAKDISDPLHAARAAEVTSLWRLAVTP